MSEMFGWLNKRSAHCKAIAAVTAALSLFSVPSPASAQAAGYEQLRAEIAQQREVAASIDREREPVAWAVARTDLASQLAELSVHQFQAESTSVLGSLEESAVLYRAALEVLTPETTRTEWLAAQEGLGDTLLLAGALRSGASAVGMLGGSYIDPGVYARDAAVAFRAVLSVQTREVDPVAWASVQTKLGNALATWVTRQRFLQAETAEIDAIQNEAEGSFRQALSAISLRENPEEWAATNEGLTNLYSMAATFIGQEYVEDAAALRRSESRRVRYLRAAIASAREAERAYQRFGDEERAQYTREQLERLREDLRPNRVAPE